MNTVSTTPREAVKQKRPTVKLFVERIKREGRHEEWTKTLAAVQAETGQRFGQAKWQAMKRMGYQGPKREHDLYVQWLESDRSKHEAEVDKKVEEKIVVIQSNETFESALNKLPTEVDPQVEIAWIRNHPAMARKARLKSNTEPVLITAEDILHVSHGPAPSRAAAIQLQNWADSPAEFNKQFAGLLKKTEGSEAAQSTECVEDVGLDVVKRLLEEVSSQCHQDRIAKAITLLKNDGYTVVPKLVSN